MEPKPNTPPASPYGRGRSSAQRRLIAETAEALGGAFTVDELVAAVRRRQSSVGTATVYRAVTALAASGWLERVGDGPGGAIWARCEATGHHHHLICTGCGSMADAACPVDESIHRAAAESGFTVTGHEVRLYGLCSSCAKGRG